MKEVDMRFMELVTSRRSIRGYKDTPLEREALEKCVEAARMAPSACNSQPWKFVIVDDGPLLEKLKHQAFGKPAGMNSFVRTAPALIFILSRREKLSATIAGLLRGTSFRRIDIGIATSHLVLQAHELGIGSCILGWFNERRVRKALRIPAKFKIELAISLGEPATTEERPARPVRPIEEILSFNGR